LLVGVGGKSQAAFTVEHADAIDPVLVRNHTHGFVGGLAIVVEHGVPSGTGNAAGELVGTEDHGFEELVLLHAPIEEAADTTDSDNQDGERQDELEVESAGHKPSAPLGRHGLRRARREAPEERTS
jgi:hypothetical protein